MHPNSIDDVAIVPAGENDLYGRLALQAANQIRNGEACRHRVSRTRTWACAKSCLSSAEELNI